MNELDWKGKSFSFFCNKNCEWFPCHEFEDEENFNCLFCYCPLYALDDKCGGNFTYTDKGVKDCSDCILPHIKDQYGHIIEKFSDIARMMEKQRKET